MSALILAVKLSSHAVQLAVKNSRQKAIAVVEKEEGSYMLTIWDKDWEIKRSVEIPTNPWRIEWRVLNIIQLEYKKQESDTKPTWAIALNLDNGVLSETFID